VIASWKFEHKELRTESIEFNVRRTALFLYCLLAFLILLILLALYVSFVIFI